MSIDFTNRLPEFPDDKSSRRETEAEEMTRSGRSRFVRERLFTVSRTFRESRIEIATLLDETQREEYWRDTHSSFRDYVEQSLKISQRTAQELLKVIRACRAANIAAATIAELEWSKVAIVAGRLTPENAVQVLADVKDKSYGELKKMVRREKAAGTQKQTRHADGKITVTEVVHEALRLACAHTREIEFQANMEFMAAKFIELCPPPSRLLRIDHAN